MRIMGWVLGILSAGAAGCFSGPGNLALTVDIGEVASVADEVAQAWRPGAVLQGAGTLEAKDLALAQDTIRARYHLMGLEYTRLRVDSRPGDGLSLLWHFAYADPASADFLSLWLSADTREVLARTELPRIMESEKHDAGAHQSWRLDAAGALAAARQDERFQDEVGRMGDPIYFIILTRLGNSLYQEGISAGSAWFLWVVGNRENESVAALVDAASGKLLSVGPNLPVDRIDLQETLWYGGLGGPGRTLVDEVHRERLTKLVAPAHAYKLQLKETELYGRDVSFGYLFCYGKGVSFPSQVPMDPLPQAGALRFTLTGPDGRLLAEEDHGGLGTGYSSAARSTDLKMAGDYTFAVELREGPLDWTAAYRLALWAGTVPPPRHFFILAFQCPV